MRFFFMGPRILGIRPGISFRPGELFGSTATKQKKPGEPITSAFLYGHSRRSQHGQDRRLDQP